MKKVFSTILFSSIMFFINAQVESKIPSHLQNISEKMIKPVNGEEIPVIINESNPYVRPKTSKDLGTIIGITWYDLQSNANNANRTMVYPDGSISTVWTMAPNGNAYWPDRGTGYNHSTNGGVTWLPIPTARIEGTLRTGWPNVGKLLNGAEIVVNHSSNGGNLSKTTNGGLTWVNANFGGGYGITWPRMVTNGNTIHVIGCSNTLTPFQGFLNGALVYLRSTDGGNNWTTPIIPTGLDTSNYARTGNFADCYSLANKGDTLAIVYGDIFRTTCLVKSTNNGNSWSYREILHLPIKKYDTEGSTMFDINHDSQPDNIYGNDAVDYVTFDNNGKVHVFFGRMKATDFGGAYGYDYFPYTDGIHYWNEDMGAIQYQYKWTMINSVNTYEAIPDTINFPIITSVVDLNHNGIIDFPNNGTNLPFGQYYSSLSSQPNAVIRPDGTIVLFYSSIVEGTNGTVGSQHKAFRNIWETHKFPNAPNNFTWSAPLRVAGDNNTEEVYPYVSPILRKSGNILEVHLWYQGDPLPGVSIVPASYNPHPIIENSIYYKNLNATEVGINETNLVKTDPLIYPNPASDILTIKFNLPEAATVNFSIVNITGQQIMTGSRNVSEGEESLTINIETLSEGFYILISNIGDKVYTNKLIIE